MVSIDSSNERDAVEPIVGETETRLILEERTEFITQDGEGNTVVVEEDILIEIEDLEACGKHGRQPRRAKSYRIVIDRQEKIVHRHEMTGRQILALVDKKPEGFTLTEKLHGGTRVRIEPDEIVVFHRQKVERFETAPKSANNGEVPLRGPLSPDDVEFLDAFGCPWRLTPFPNVGGAPGSAGYALILSGYRLPSAFSPDAVEMMIRIPPLYPAMPLDMFNTFPHVSRVDGRPVAFVTLFPFEGQQWQQWSRHRKPENTWNFTIDSLATHMALVESALTNDAG